MVIIQEDGMVMKMAKSGFICLLFLLVFCSSPVMAIDLYGYGSYWDKGDLEGKWGGGLGLSLGLFTDFLRVDGRAYLFENADLGTDELKLLPFDVGLQVHLLPDEMLDPYLLAGVSYIYADVDVIDVDSHSIGGYIGAGLDLMLGDSPLKIFGEALYRFNEIKTDHIEDIDVSGFTGNMGLKLHF